MLILKNHRVAIATWITRSLSGRNGVGSAKVNVLGRPLADGPGSGSSSTGLCVKSLAIEMHTRGTGGCFERHPVFEVVDKDLDEGGSDTIATTAAGDKDRPPFTQDNSGGHHRG